MVADLVAVHVGLEIPPFAPGQVQVDGIDAVGLVGVLGVGVPGVVQ